MSDLFNERCLSERPAGVLRDVPALTPSTAARSTTHGALASAPMPLFASRQRSLFEPATKWSAVVAMASAIAAR